MFDNLLSAGEYCQAVRCVLRIVVQCAEVYNHSVRMHSIAEVLVSYEFEVHIQPGAQTAAK